MGLYAKGPRQLVMLLENIMRDSSEMLIERRDGGRNRLWEADGQFKTRSYKKKIGDEVFTIQFIYESRDEDTGRIEVTGAGGVDKLSSLFKCIPDVKSGISELFIGERVMTKAEVYKNGNGLEVGLVCPFCKLMVNHQCKEAKRE